MWPKVGLELGQAIGPCVPRVGLKAFGEHVGEDGEEGEEEEGDEEGEGRRRPLGSLLGYSGVLLGQLCGLGGILRHSQMPFWGYIGVSWGHFDRLGRISEVILGHIGRPGGVLGQSRRPSWAILEGPFVDFEVLNVLAVAVEALLGPLC